MSDFVQHILDTAPSAEGQPDWWRTYQNQAREQLLRNGLPDRRDEAWKYTPLKTLERRRFDGPQDAIADVAAEEAPVRKLLAGADGIYLPLHGADAQRGVDAAGQADGLSLRWAWQESADALAAFLQQDAPSHAVPPAFSQLNTAAVTTPISISVDEAASPTPLLLDMASSPQSISQPRLFVRLAAGARLRIIEHLRPGAGSFSNALVQIDLQAGARLEWVRLQDADTDASVVTRCQVRAATDAGFRYWGFDLGGRLVRHDIDVDLAEAGARAELNGAYLLDGARHVDNHSRIDHRSGDTRSRLDFRGVLRQRSRGVFNGKAMIHPGADGSAVEQSNANLLLSAGAEIDTKPELEIYADDVTASHGATVGQLDTNALFYLMSRGLSEERARTLLTTGFVAAVADSLPDWVDSAVLRQRLEESLQA